MTGLLGLSPSTAGRWMPCGGSVVLSQPYLAAGDTQETSEAKLEGIAADWVIAQLHAGTAIMLGQTAPNGVVIDEEMLDAASEYLSLLPPGTQLEVPVPLGNIAPGMTGRIDAMTQYPVEPVIDLWDFKYGHGLVEEFENWQLLVEAAGVAHLAGAKTMRLHIFQPRCYQAQSHRVWEVTQDEYLREYLPHIQAAARDVMTGRAPTRTGTHCRNCPAAASCDALALVGYDIIDRTKAAVSTELTPNQLALELHAIHAAEDRIKARRVGLEENASALIRNGGRVPGYTLTPEVGRKAWSTPHETVIAMAKLSNVDVRKPTAAITPTQAIKAGMSEAMVNSMSACPPKAPKLSKVNPNQARKVFK